jgi:FkbM family methyltransferase
MTLAPERPLATNPQTHSIARGANRAAISALARARSAAVNSRLPLFRPLAVLGQAQTVASRRVRGVDVRMLIEDYCDYAVFKSWETAEPKTLDWVDALPAAARFLDIGSNIGRFSLYAALRHPGLIVTAVDPDARVSHRLARSSAINGCGARIAQLLLGASDSDGHERLVFNFRIQQGHLGGAHITEPETFAYTVETMRIDTMVERDLIAPPTHIKIDVDGHEAAVVRGAAKTLRDPHLRSVIIEVDGETAEPVDALMRAAGLGEASRARLSSGLVNVVYERHA